MNVVSHSAETCPAHNSKYRAITVNWYEKVEPIATKYGIKFLGSWTDYPVHTIYVLFDTPSMDTFMKFIMEPEMDAPLAFSKVRAFPVLDHKQALSMLKK